MCEALDRLILRYTLATVVTSYVAKSSVSKCVVIRRRILILKDRVRKRANHEGR